MGNLEQLGLERVSNDNLHAIAISNIKDGKKRIEKWWRKKYRIPPKEFEEYVWEELILEMLEDYYIERPGEAQKTLANISKDSEWDGKMPDYYESNLKETHKKFFERNKVDLSRWQSDKVLSESEEKKILNNIGKKLPKSLNKKSKSVKLNEDEFEDVF